MAQQGETFAYTVQRGDSCARIAQRFYGDWRRYDVILRLNPELQEGGRWGSCGPYLRPGVVLRLARDPGPAPDSPDARLTALRRRVQARQPEQTSWQQASQGLGLFQGWRVNTLERATAELTFRDASIVHMRENTLVIIFGGEARQARRRTTRARLERGALRSRLGDLRLDVSTPSAEAQLDGGSAVVSVDAEGTSRLSNFEGGPASVRGSEGDPVPVRSGFGSEVRRGGRPSTPSRLPAAPRWRGGEREFVALVGEGGTLEGAWRPVPSARLYRVEVGLGRPGGAVVAATEVSADVTQFSLQRLPPGSYWVTVSTIDDRFFESRPSRPLRLRLWEVDVRAPGAGPSPSEPPDPFAEPAVPQVVVGSEVVGPSRVRCGPGEGQARTLDEVGRAEVVCTRRGRAFPPLTVNVVAPRLDAGPAEARTLFRGTEHTLEWSYRSPVSLPVLDVEGEGIRVRSVERPAPGRVVVRVAVAEDAPETLELRLVAEDVWLGIVRYRTRAAPD